MLNKIIRYFLDNKVITILKRMKRFTAILLLLFMLMSAVQPVLAMHFCGDKLYSFSLLQGTGNSGVCCENNAAKENKDPLQGHLPKGEADHRVTLDDTHASCCDTQLLKPGTDDYQTKTEQSVILIGVLNKKLNQL
jgi:hypothetical protein